jgi:murein DD-endopeptidase MepM/ murein hydrolase activator NlpD
MGRYAAIWSAITLLAAHLTGCGTAPCTPDPEQLYYLPYEPGTASLVVQGNHGPFSHQNEYAIDFLMPMHTPILAARDGVVAQSDDTHTETCWLTQDCPGNRVVIRHEDGTKAGYWHLETGGARVAVGDWVRRGQLIAYSGQTGIAFAPHLHFIVWDSAGQSIEVHFADVCENDGVPQVMHRYGSQNDGGSTERGG